MDADQFDAQLRHAPARAAAGGQALPAMARPGAAPQRSGISGTGRVLATGAAVISSTNEDGSTSVDYKRKSKMANQPVCPNRLSDDFAYVPLISLCVCVLDNIYIVCMWFGQEI
jgi:hypothetical protein